MPFVMINNYNTTITGSITSTSTSLSVNSTSGFPTLSTGEIIPLTLSALNNVEIVYVTAISGSTLTIERGQEGTTAQAWNSGTNIGCFPTVGTLEPMYGPSSYSTLAGTTAGTIDWSQPQQGFYKRFAALLTGYENDTTTSQSITFPTPFLSAPFTVANNTGLTITATTTTLTITAPDNTTLYSGIILLEGI